MTSPIPITKSKTFHMDLPRAIRCSLLHQAETYGSFIIRREETILHSDGKIVNTTKFAKPLKSFWNHTKKNYDQQNRKIKLFSNCKAKIRYIITNSTEKK